MKAKHLPNLITAVRLCLVIPFLASMYYAHYLAGFYLFVIAGASDGLDGLLARRYHWQSHLGGILDPLADKLFVAASTITLALLHRMPWALVALIFSRDFCLSLGTLTWQAYFGHIECKASRLSKINTILQGLLIFFLLFELAYFPLASQLKRIMLIAVSLSTIASFMHYASLWGQKAYYRLKQRREMSCS